MSSEKPKSQNKRHHRDSSSASSGVSSVVEIIDRMSKLKVKPQPAKNVSRWSDSSVGNAAPSSKSTGKQLDSRWSDSTASEGEPPKSAFSISSGSSGGHPSTSRPTTPANKNYAATQREDQITSPDATPNTKRRERSKAYSMLTSEPGSSNLRPQLDQADKDRLDEHVRQRRALQAQPNAKATAAKAPEKKTPRKDSAEGFGNRGTFF